MPGYAVLSITLRGMQLQPNELFNHGLEREIERAIKLAIEEDLGELGDITSKATVDSEVEIRAEILVKSPGVIAGLAVAEKVFKFLDPDVSFTSLINDGDFANAGIRIAEVSGSARAILSGERTALNFLQHLSGIATETSKYVREIEGYGVELLDTRKTTPTLRFLEKYASRVGGAVNHRFGLYDQYLIKDNHIRIVGDINEAVRRARALHPDVQVEIEAETIDEVKEAVDAGADIILLDNMDVNLLEESVKIIGDRAIKEASGGINLSNIAGVAATGIDRISVGAITQAAKPLDISLEVIE